MCIYKLFSTLCFHNTKYIVNQSSFLYCKSHNMQVTMSNCRLCVNAIHWKHNKIPIIIIRTGTLSWSMEKLHTIQVCPIMFSGRGAPVRLHRCEQNRVSRWVDGHTLLCSWWKTSVSSARVSTVSTDSKVPSHSSRVSLSKKKLVTSWAEMPCKDKNTILVIMNGVK